MSRYSSEIERLDRTLASIESHRDMLAGEDVTPAVESLLKAHELVRSVRNRLLVADHEAKR